MNFTPMRIRPNIYVRMAITLGCVAAYAAVFFMLYPSAGSATAALTVVLMVVVGWLLGVRWSVVFGILIIVPLNSYLLRMEGDPYAANIISYIIASFAFTLVGMIIGWVRELLARVNQQAHELREEIGRRKKAEERLSHEALHDPLTNLANRRLFATQLEHAIEWNKRRPNDPFAVVYLDFDNFKIINDSHGHNVGDQFLLAMAQRLKSAVRTSDTVARMGGDEFAILLEALKNDEEVFIIVKRTQENLAIPFDIGGHSIVMTASMGIVINHQRYEHLDDIMRDADIAMYVAKTSGRNQYKVFDDSMRQQAQSISSLENGSHDTLNKKF